MSEKNSALFPVVLVPAFSDLLKFGGIPYWTPAIAGRVL